MAELESKAKKNKRIDPTVEEEDKRPAGTYVKHRIQVSARTDSGPAVFLEAGTKLEKDDLSPEDTKRLKKNGTLEVVR